jgi:hypothetical protein
MGRPKPPTQQTSTEGASDTCLRLNAVDDGRTTDFSFAIAPWPALDVFLPSRATSKRKEPLLRHASNEQKPGEAAESRHAMCTGFQPIQPAN